MLVRFGTGLFVRVDGQVIEDFEGLVTGTITQLPALTGIGCSFAIGVFEPRVP